MPKVCLLCQKEKQNGSKIIEDPVVKTIRWAKRKLKIEKGNEIVICEECMENYKKKRKNFEWNILAYLLICLVITISIVLIAHSISSFLIALIFSALLILLAIIAYYVPAIEPKSAETTAQPEKKNA